jgi:hypothetical protein
MKGVEDHVVKAMRSSRCGQAELYGIAGLRRDLAIGSACRQS